MKKILALILTAVMLCTFMTSCSNAYKNYDKYIEIGDLKKIELSEAKILKKVADAILDIRDSSREEYFVELEGTDVVSQNGDKLNIDFAYKSHKDLDNADLKLSEETLKGMSAEKSDLVLGSGTFVGAYTDLKNEERNNKGFEEQLEGKKIGDKVDVTVTFPSKYSTAELQDVIVVFEVTINSISRSSIDITNKELLANISYVFTDPDAKKEDEDKDSTDDKTEKEKSKFTDLFKSDDLSIDLSSEEFDKFNTIFEISKIVEALDGKEKLEEFEIEFTVPEDVAESEDKDVKAFADYAGRTIKVTFTVDEIEILPDWTDDFVKKHTKEKYTTTKDYEDYLYKDFGTSMAITAIIDSAKFIEVPWNETKKAYKSALESNITSILQSLSSSSTAQVDIGNYTQDEFELLVDKESYSEANTAAMETAIKSVKSRLVYEYLFDKLGVTLSKKDYNTKLEEFYNENKTYYMYYFGITDVQGVEDYFGKETLETEFKYDILAEKLLDQVTVK
ncbi:MAG: hypothetical protein E7633_05795 [Ruminococcaceae bacterium]|nr:hypothetical protein [Oscillospiraceae bacterium]